MPTRMSGEGFGLFLELVGATPPKDLGDGEAATLAQALECGAVAVIDERKARGISKERWPQATVLRTVDLFGCAEVRAPLRPDELADAIYNALIHARMRVAAECREWVRAVIGEERSRSCRSLGRMAS